METKKVTLKIIRYAITPSATNKRHWAIYSVLSDGNGGEIKGPIRCHADSKRQARMLKDQFNHMITGSEED